jgi:putative hydrolase of the HAD superfamily
VTDPVPAICAVCFDLDDTLYPQAEWLDGAWTAVATRAAADGVDERAMRAALERAAAEGSDSGRIIDRALEALGAPTEAVDVLVHAFRLYAPPSLEPYPGVRSGLVHLADRVPLGLISDGDPEIQRAKLTALGLGDVFSTVVWSDEHGRDHRKPDPLPFRVAVDLLGVAAPSVVYVGDRPAKDVEGSTRAGLTAIRVRTGEWAATPDDPRAWASVPTVADAIDLIGATLAAQIDSTPTSSRNSTSPGTSR